MASCGDPDRRTADRAAQQPGAELHRHGATRRRRQLIADELAEGEEHEDPRRPGVARERRASCLSKASRPDQAAKLIAVGAVRVRRPATMPIRNANRYTSEGYPATPADFITNIKTPGVTFAILRSPG